MKTDLTHKTSSKYFVEYSHKRFESIVAEIEHLATSGFRLIHSQSYPLPTITHFKHLTEQALPTQARIHRWPIRLDHCFKRICLDHAFTGVWHHHLPRPAERHLTGDPLARAIHCAEQILAQGLPLLTERNTASLRYRGKLPQQ